MKEIRLQNWMALAFILPAMFALGGVVSDLVLKTNILGMTGIKDSIWMLGLVLIGLPSLSFIMVQGNRDSNAIVKLVNMALSVVLLADVVFFVAACVKAV